MAISPITSGYTFPARLNQGGIRAAYIGTYNDTATTFTFGATGGTASGVITAIGGVTQSMFTVTNRQGQGSFTVTPTIGANGCVAYEQTVELTIENVDNNLANWIQILNQGIWRIMIKDAFGQYWMCGLINGAYTVSAPGGPGKAWADGNKTVLTFRAEEPSYPSMVSSTAALSVIQ